MTQHMQALNRANHIRLERVRLKREIRTLPRPEAMTMVADIVESPPDFCLKVTAFDAVTWVRFVGRFYALSILRRADVPEMKALGDLTPRQRDALASLLRLGERSCAA